MASEAVTTTARSLLVQWANDQDHWVRALVSEVIESRKSITDDRARHFYEFLLVEKELKVGELTPVPPLEAGDEVHDEEDALSITSLSAVERVNVLAPEQEIEFNPRMTVLFGENASGKSGYVRILKSVASVRTAERILPDVSKPPTDEKPHALIAYRLGAQDDTADWNGENGVAPFTRIDVFDTRGLLLHVDHELTYVYTPGDLSLFPLVHEGIERVKKKLDDTRTSTLPTENPFLPSFKRDDPVYAKIESLGASTDIAELERLAAVPEAEQAGLNSLRETVDALRSRSVDARLTIAKNDGELYTSVWDAVATVDEFDGTAYNAAVADVIAAEENYTRATKDAFEGTTIPGVLTNAWIAFIQSGDEYLRATRLDEYPEADETCIYCHQPLTEAAVTLVKKYRDFCNNELKQAVDDAQDARDKLAQNIRSLATASLKEDIEKAATSIKEGEEPPQALRFAVAFVTTLQELAEAVEQNTSFDGGELDACITRLKPAVRAKLTDVQSLTRGLSEQAEERKQAFEAESMKLRSLEARMKLRDLLSQVRGHVEATKWADKAKTISTRLSYTVNKSLTNTSKVASKELLNNNFEELFQTECQALRAPTVKLDFPGGGGQAARKKMLSPVHKLSDILSEGEQKVIALADFVAEASLRQKASPIVFDDPVNSLDYRRLSYVVERLVGLSETRQVIVFTHNIWFATQLLAAFEENTDGCTYYDIAESNGVFGVVNPGSHPRWDTYKTTKGRINALIQDAEAATGETQRALIESGYGRIRSITEIISEQELFCGVTQRYTPHVAMTKLRAIKPHLLQDAIDVIFPIYQKCCRIIEAHSQPLETLGVRPNIDELKADWQSVLDAREAYRKG